MLRSVLTRFRAMVFRARHEAELDEELQYHLDREIERNVAAGMAVPQARAAARRVFGSAATHKEDVREAWRWRWLDDIRQDFLFAIRSYRREPTLVLTVVLTIGLGVGINAAAFTLFNAYVLRPAPVRDPGSLQDIVWHSKSKRGHRFTWDQYRELAALPAVAEALGYRNIFTRFEQQRVAGLFVTGNYFSMLGVGPSLGRVLQRDDAEAPGAVPVAVLNHRFWTTSFGADSGVIGRTLRIRGVPLTIIGVAPKGFDGLEDSRPDFWMPITMATVVENRPDLFTANEPDLAWVVARFRPGVGPEQGSSAVEHWLRQITADRADADRVTSVTITSRATPNALSAKVVLGLLPVAVAFGLVLLTACANVASMMVARGVARQREIGIRLAVGAGRRRLICQLLTESLVLAIPAAAAGFLISRLIVGGALQVLFATMPETFGSLLRMASLESDARVYLFMVVASAGSAVLFGLIPALQATRPVIGRATRTTSRLRRILVVGQIAVAALLLITTGVLLRGAERAERVDVGFPTGGILVLDLNPALRGRVTEHLRRIPEVRMMAATNTVPLVGASRGVGIQREPGNPVQGAVALRVSADFFALLRIELVRGRGFADDEGQADAPVAVVNEKLAQLWAGAAVGQSMLVIEGAAPPRSVRVIGVVPDVVTGWIGERAHRPTIFFPSSLTAPGTRVLIRVDDDSPAAQLALEDVLGKVDPASTDNIFSMTDVVAVSTYPLRLAYWIGAAVGLVALLLALTGVFGVMAFVVAQRTREIGVRLALGSTRGRVVRLIMGESARLAAIGIGIGLPLAVGTAAAVSSAIEIMDVFEPVAYLGGGAVVLLACAAGALIPSRRAAQVAPLEAIRAD